MDIETKPPAKYYRPAKEELHVDYEIESHEWSRDERGVPELNYDRWVTTKLTQSYLDTILTYGGNGWRVPFLTEEQVLEEGWSLNFHGLYSKKVEEWYYHAMIDFENHTLEISKTLNLRMGKTFFIYVGKCPSINEFRKICKLVLP